jgi:hypothetical protein
VEHHHAHDPAGDLEPVARAGHRGKDGTGDTVFTAFLSPANPGTGSGARPGRPDTDELECAAWQQELGHRPSFVVLHLRTAIPGCTARCEQHLVGDEQQDGRFVQQRARPAVRQLQLRRAAVPHERADPHRRLEGRQWQSMDGAGRRRVGKIFHFGKLPVNSQLSAYYNVVRPDFGANWQIRAQVQLMFPK